MDVRQRILTAAVDRLTTSGYNGMTISAVATRAGVSRPTVYAHFGSRENLASEALTLVSLRMLDSIAEQVGERTSAAEYLVEMMVSACAAFRAHPALAPLARPDLGTMIFDGAILEPASLSMARHFLSPLLKFQPELEPEMDEIAETCIRFIVSVVQFRSALIETHDDLRHYLHRRLVPAVGLAPISRDPSGAEDGHGAVVRRLWR